MANSDDLLSPNEIEALLKQAQSPAKPKSPEPAAHSGGSGDLLDINEIEQLMNQGKSSPAPSAPKHSTPKPAAPKPSAPVSQEFAHTERLINQAEADLAAAIAPDLNRPHVHSHNSNTQVFEFRQFGVNNPPEKRRMELDALQNVELDLRIELGRTQLLIEEVLALQSGTVVPLDKLAGDPVDIIVNNRLVARGEVLVLNDNFCVRVSEIVSPEN